MAGTFLSHYRLVAELGRGGMGVVYKAEDQKLQRIVALKVLPVATLSSETQKTRFYREAQAAAQLHHPNIATVFEIDEAIPRIVEESTRNGNNESDLRTGAEISEGLSVDEDNFSDTTTIANDFRTSATREEERPFIAMEFIEGETLRDRIESGPLPLKECFRIATEIALALDAAHKKNIVHRDVKSANVMLTNDGVAKVLDFGLAKTAHSTILTKSGTTIGTISYMSPEQARGEEVDHRTDLWSLGVVLYEMIAGRNPFPGQYEQAVLYTILNVDAEPLTAVRSDVPMSAEWVVSKLLAKSPDRRYQSAREVIIDLSAIDPTDVSGFSRSARSGIVGSAVKSRSQFASSPALAIRRRLRDHPFGFAVVSLVLGVLLSYLLIPRGGTDGDSVIRRLRIEFPGIQRIISPELSPKGEYLTFVGSDSLNNTGLFLYEMSTGQMNYVTNTTSAKRPLFSPDGQWIIYESARKGIFKINVPNGTPIPIHGSGLSPIWLDNSTILFAENNTLYSIPSIGDEEPSRRFDLTTIDPSITLRGFRGLSPRNSVLAEVRDVATGVAHMAVLDLSTSVIQRLMPDACCAQYSDTGHLLYIRKGTEGDLALGGQVFARPFDRNEFKFTGDPVIQIADANPTSFSVGKDGTLIYAPDLSTLTDHRFSWLDSELGLLPPPQWPENSYNSFQVSPDGGRITAEFQDTDLSHSIVVFDLNSGIETPLAMNGEFFGPTWSPDGIFIYYYAIATDWKGIARRRADGSGTESFVIPDSFDPSASQDGIWLVYATMADSSGQNQLRGYNIETGEHVSYDTLSSFKSSPSYSPDGSYVVYYERKLDTREVVVRSTDGMSRWPVTSGGYVEPSWAPDGAYLYYQSLDTSALFRVPVSVTPTFRKTGDPEPIRIDAPQMAYAIDPKDGRILIKKYSYISENRDNAVLFFVLNWDEEVKRTVRQSN